jgi:hypothetical protein
VTVFIGRSPKARLLARTMGAALPFVQFSVIDRRTLRKTSVDQAPRARKDGALIRVGESINSPGTPLVTIPNKIAIASCNIWLY